MPVSNFKELHNLIISKKKWAISNFKQYTSNKISRKRVHSSSSGNEEELEKYKRRARKIFQKTSLSYLVPKIANTDVFMETKGNWKQRKNLLDEGSQAKKIDCIYISNVLYNTQSLS